VRRVGGGGGVAAAATPVMEEVWFSTFDEANGSICSSHEADMVQCVASALPLASVGAPWSKGGHARPIGATEAGLCYVLERIHASWCGQQQL